MKAMQQTFTGAFSTSESAEFPRPAARLKGWSEGQTEEPFTYILGGGRDPELN